MPQVFAAVFFRFQSTRPREARQGVKCSHKSFSLFQSTRPREARLYKCNWLIYNNIEFVSREDVFFLTCQRTIPYHILNKDLIINECERPGIPNGIICSRNSIPIKVLPCRNFG